MPHVTQKEKRVLNKRANLLKLKLLLKIKTADRVAYAIYFY